MRVVLFTFCCILCFAYPNRHQINEKVRTAIDTIEEFKESAAVNECTIDSTVNVPENLSSTYDKDDHSGRLQAHRDTLRAISNRNVFSLIHEKLVSELNGYHQDFFRTNQNYELLSYCYGDLFQEKGNDAAFVIYDKIESRIVILVYDEKSGEYLQLYEDVLVENGLEECYYGSSTTLDFQIGNELIWQKEYLLIEHESYLQYSPCKIVNISDDPDFILSRGCFAKGISETNTPTLLCLPVSCVYNNWECLKYDKSRHLFTIIYGQAFAD